MQLTAQKAQNQKKSDLIAQLGRLGFIKISDFPREDFLPFQKHIRHSDLVYSLLYGWELDFGHRIQLIDGNPVLVGFDITGEVYFTVIPAAPETLMQSVRTALRLFAELHVDVILKYITAEYADLFAQNGFALTFDPDFSDYIYDNQDFIDTAGSRNKAKRREYQNITKQYGDSLYEDMNPENLDDMTRVFDKWCANHSCEECVWGCEKRVYLRLIDLVRRDPERYYGGLVYLDNEPMAFGLAEKVNEDWVIYHVQKNAVPINGLTYYLHYHMAQKHLEIPTMNWCEDLGIEGLRVNKQKYRPCHLEHKYERNFRCEP